MSAAGAIRVRELTKAYRSPAGVQVQALRDLTLDLPAGGMVAVTAPSGGGKSTLLHVLGAMDAPDSGRVFVDDTEVTALSRRGLVGYRRTVGFVFQRFHLIAALTALDNVMAPVLPYRTDFDKVARAHDLLDAVGLGDRTDALPSQLSGGQQQRVAIARALVNRPRLLLADEPTGNLDSATGAEILDLVVELNRTRQMTVVLATHDESVAERCNHRVRLLDGALVE